MAAKIKFFVTNPKGETAGGKNQKIKKLEQVNILVRFYYGKQFDVSAKTNKLIKPGFWNNSSGETRGVADFKDRDRFQQELNNLKLHILQEYNNTPDKTKINKDWLEVVIDKYYNPTKYLQTNTLFGFIQYFINNSEKRTNPDTGNPVCYKMRREYEVTFNYLKEYAKIYGEPDFNDIDLEFYEEFLDFIRKCTIKRKDGTEKPLANNTIEKKIQTLKIFMNAATE